MPFVFPKLRAPIVLVHGLLGCGERRVAGITISEYFPGIAPQLRSAGNRVLVPNLTPTACVAHRAAELRAFIERQAPGEPVHIMAHSMGGLDARYMVSRLGMQNRVLTLTTLGTPHRGTSFADWGIKHLSHIVRPILEFLGWPTGAFRDLTTTACRKFNDEVPNAAGVRYFSVAGRHDGNWLLPEWLLPHYHVLLNEGDNDGVVSVSSANWGESREVWDGDHFSLVNWLHPFGHNRGWNRDPGPRFGPLVRRLADEGF